MVRFRPSSRAQAIKIPIASPPPSEPERDLVAKPNHESGTRGLLNDADVRNFRGIESLLDACLFKAGSKILEVGFKKLLLPLELGNLWSEAGKLGECRLGLFQTFLFGPQFVASNPNTRALSVPSVWRPRLAGTEGDEITCEAVEAKSGYFGFEVARAVC